MSNKVTSVARVAALAVLINGLAIAGVVHAANAQDSSQDSMDQSTTNQTAPAPSDTVPEKMEHGQMKHSPADMARHVEERIKMLHAKLKITRAEEAKWSDVAQAMRDNEAASSALIEERHQNSGNMTAVDDMQSYAAIVQAHADGIKKLIPVFQSLYNDMSDEQKAEADKVFSSHKGEGMHKRSK